MGKNQRKAVPISVKREILMEAGYMCANPRCRHVLTLEIHHIVWVKDDGGNDPSNLIALCPNCHSLHTSGKIPKSAISHWKGMLLALNHAFDRDGMDLLLFLHHTKDKFPIWYSGDGVLKFARLIAAGLVECSGLASCNVGFGQMPTSSHKVYLSKMGTLLVEAWLSGDEEKYRELLERSPT
jgi:hypothetical protein